VDDALVWNVNWAWSVPLIVVNVIYHVMGLAFINEMIVQRFTALKGKHDSMFVFALVMGATTLLATLLHSIEAGIWAGVYWSLGALPDGKSALLLSILFGLTTTFFYSIIREVWPSPRTNHSTG
jgi:hypothetical protein